MKKKSFLVLVTFVVGFSLFLPVNIFARMSSDNYIIYADVFSSGGSSTSTSASYSLHDTLGEALIISATSTSASYGTKAGFQEMYPDQYLSFSVGATSVALGTLSSSAVSSASHTMTVDTNSTHGFTITVSGNTLTKVGATIDAIGAIAAASNPGTEQFGINLVANTSPSVGADPSGTAPIGSAASNYDTANQFAYNSGGTVASATTDINTTTYTVSYMANITALTQAGLYSTTLTYAATANF